MPNPTPTPSPALAVDAIERLIAKADAQVAWAGSVFRAKEVARAVAQLTAPQQAVAEAQKDRGPINVPLAAKLSAAVAWFAPLCAVPNPHIEAIGEAVNWMRGSRGKSAVDVVDTHRLIMDDPFCRRIYDMGRSDGAEMERARTPDPAREEQSDG